MICACSLTVQTGCVELCTVNEILTTDNGSKGKLIFLTYFLNLHKCIATVTAAWTSIIFYAMKKNLNE